MRRMLLLMMLSPAAFGQTPAFPTAIASDETIGVSKDQASATLTAALDASSLTVYVSNGAAFAQYQIVQIDNELTQVCSIAGNVLTLCTGSRGYDGTTATTHKVGRRVAGAVSARYINALREEVQAIETALGANLENVVASLNPGTLTEIADPAAPSANAMKLYAYDIGGATYMCAKNADGDTFCIAPSGVQINSTSPTTITGKHQTGTIAEPSAGYTNFGFDVTTGIPVYRVNGGSKLSLASLSGTETLTNKTLDAEGTGNSLTVTSKAWLEAAGCQNATAGLMWDTPTSNPAVAACVTGTNTQKGVAAFADAASLSMQRTLMLPSDWTGAIDARFKWYTSATSGSVVWQIATSCVADAETDDPSWNTASTVTDAAKGTANQTNDATITGITATGCAAGELLHIKVLRDAAHASDDLAATANLIGVELTIRRTM